MKTIELGPVVGCLLFVVVITVIGALLLPLVLTILPFLLLLILLALVFGRRTVTIYHTRRASRPAPEETEPTAEPAEDAADAVIDVTAQVIEDGSSAKRAEIGE